MFAEDHPDKFKLVAVDSDGKPLQAIDPRREDISRRIAWTKVLKGSALNKFNGNDQTDHIAAAIEARKRGGMFNPFAAAPMAAGVQEFGPDGKPLPKVE